MEIQLSLTKLVLLIIFTTIFGYTIFTFLAEISGVFGKLLGYITISGTKIAAKTLTKTGQTIDAGADMISGVIEHKGNKPEEVSLRDKLLKEDKLKKREDEISNELEKALDSRTFNVNTEYISQSDTNDLIQSRGNVKKKGWCLVGVDNGIRGCVSVSKDDTCMSGNVYPTHDICVNPSLRM